MPIYEYRCEQGHTTEVMQRMSDDPVTVCSTCEAPVQRVFNPVAVHFKGSGFYNTDYGKKRRGGGSDAGEGGESKSGSSEGGASDGGSSDGGSSSDGGGSGSGNDKKAASSDSGSSGSSSSSSGSKSAASSSSSG